MYAIDTSKVRVFNDVYFTMEIPAYWQPYRLQGIDSHAGGISITQNDSVMFDFGFHANRLNEYPPVVLDESMRPDMNTDIDSSAVVYVPNSRVVDPDLYRKTNIFWDTIGGLRAKLVVPIRTGAGITGVYFDSVPYKGKKYTFCMYGENPATEIERLLLRAIQTIRFRQND